MRKHFYWDVLKGTMTGWSQDNLARLSAALAYYTVFSLAPILIICIAIAGMVFGSDVAHQNIITQLNNTFGTSTATQIQTMIAGASKPTTNIIATIIGIIVLLFGAAGVFGELQNGLNAIWGVKTNPNHSWYSLIKDRFLSFAMVLGIAFLLLVSMVISTIITALQTYLNNFLPGATFLWWIINFIISIGVITLLFAMIFKILPDVNTTWRDVWLGAFLTAVLFSLGKFILEIYLAKSNIASAYGTAGSLILILLWVYYSSQILFTGVEFTKVHTLKRGIRVKPTKDAVFINKS